MQSFSSILALLAAVLLVGHGGASSQSEASSQIQRSSQPISLSQSRASSQFQEPSQPITSSQSRVSSQIQRSSQPISSSQSRASSEPEASSQNEQTVLTGTVGSQVTTEISIPTTIASIASLTSISTSIITNSQSIVKMPKRGLSHGTLKPLEKSLEKRTLKTPADYSGDVDKFLLNENLFADKLNISGDHGGIPTGFSEPHADKRFSKIVDGLFGGTSVVVASQAGVWMSHFWEFPSFRAKAGNGKNTRGPQDVSNFRNQVLDPMQKGDIDIPGLMQYTTDGNQFSQAQNPVWAIITPRSPNGTAGDLKYKPEVNEIQDTLGNLFSGVAPVIVDYEPKSNPLVQLSLSSFAGKILFQYDPFEAVVQDSEDPCKVYQQATFRLWFEESPDTVLSKDWAAEGNQLIKDFATDSQNHPQRKRDNAPACSSPSSLLQASTESGSEPNMSPSKAPDPGSTFFTTLSQISSTTPSSSDSQASSTTPSSSDSPTSSTTPSSSSTPPPPTTPPPPPPITSPPPAPSGGVSCGSGSPDLSPQSISHLMMNFCKGTANYDPGAPTVDSSHPLADLSDIPDGHVQLPVLNNLYATLIKGRPNCASATFGFGASSSLCQEYIKSITGSCTQVGGALTSAGCFDFGVKAYTAGRGHAQW